MRIGLVRTLAAAATIAAAAWCPTWAQVSLPPSADCHITDGSFTACPNGTTEWSDVTPLAFPATDSYLYVNQDPGHTTLYLMYDFPLRTISLAPTDSVHINFNTVEQFNGQPRLVVYDIYMYGDGSVRILQQGQPTPAGHIVAAAGFGPSPNSSTPHVTAELQVPLIAEPPSTYSPDPLYWNATLPPTPPPDPCPTGAGKAFNDCVKSWASAGGTIFTLGGIAAGTIGGLCTAGTIGACAPAETALIIGGGISAALGYLLDKYIAGDPVGLILTIAPDSNYTTLAQPAVYSLLAQTQGLPSDEAAALNAWYAGMERAIALAQAGITSIARAEGASAAGNGVWVTEQTQAAQSFGTQLGAVLATLPSLQANVAAAFQAEGTQSVFIGKQVSTFMSDINPNSPPTEVQSQYVLAEQALGQLGFTSDDLSLIMQIVQANDPAAVATLGNGIFPQALSDPTFSTQVGQLAAGLGQNVPAQSSLGQSYSATLAGDYVAAGVGLRGQTSGNITIAGVPAGATVVKAFLYWGMLDNGVEPSLGQLSFDNTPVTGSLIGSGPDTCWGRSNSFTYRAVVTSLVSGNGTYALTGVATGGNVLAEGASLVVIYQLDGAPVKTIMVDDGNISMPYGTQNGSAAFSGFTATSPVGATTTFMVGDGQEAEFDAQTPTSFTGSAGTINFPNLFNSLNGPLWDTATFNVSGAVAPGTSPDTANINIAGDCLLWSAQAFSVTSTPVATPLVATAAFVEAGANGNTIATPQSVTTNSAPTIEQQVQDVVQFRIIQNRGLVASTLLGQLLNGLVTDGVIDDQQASSIQTSVLGKVVTPPAPRVCDVNGDGQIDKSDIALITSALNTPASGSNDPRDANHDGIINLLDARKCVTECTHVGCALQ